MKDHETVRNTLDSVKRSMKAVKGSLKNTAVLRKMTRLAPEVGNATRWTSWGQMMHKYLRIRSDLISAADDNDASITVNRTTGFKKRAEKISGLFEDINMVAWSMQTRLQKLSVIRNDLNELLEECEAGHNNPDSDWYQRKLPGTYTSADSGKLPGPHFVPGIIKIKMIKVFQSQIVNNPCCKVLQPMHKSCLYLLSFSTVG